MTAEPMPPMPSDSWRWISYSDPVWGDTAPYEESDAESDYVQACVRHAIDQARRQLGISTIKAASLVEEASKIVFNDIVVESRCQPRRMRWKEIGARLGVARQTAQKRFRAGLSPQRVTQLHRQLEQFRSAYLDRRKAEDLQHREDRALIGEAIHGLTVLRSFGGSAYLGPDNGGHDLPPSHSRTANEVDRSTDGEAVHFVVNGDRWTRLSERPARISDTAMHIEGDRLVRQELAPDEADE
ncbi:hypothetical protein G4Z16_01030 [Streptomyces bathyalis]|uniref:Uncharacterized protein n=1 Tax=Streptomyces bathyalis TaxID=2710756 RepID=A0A7T1WQI2_9ACTN|nr:hypothetical protein [Streptomyces bathyalis]QPP05201.1 hypothetical protein G4Z16_01030 [Streptomyces bathyalis]